ncbi:hypothetical protein ZIOFF_052596 [Zingiber officinale]|uniref:glutathione transferase n=1 Tax=Zingiber officinale TaxID=94328 RepID=A0A8J5G485_ZINOF|nr:hypothetical protein ZIOFF_052596 [Zingiber officinale]
MVVQVYGKAQAVCPQRVMHCLVELGLPFELVHVDIDAMEHKLPEYLEKQTLNSFIVSFPCFSPSDRFLTSPMATSISSWMDVEAINYNPWAFPVVFNLLVLPLRGAPGDREAAAAAVEEMSRVLEVYEKQLSKSKYLAGDEFTLADLTHIPATRYVVELCGGAHIFEGKERVKAWWEDITGRPAWKKVISFVESGKSSYSP